MQTSRQSSNPNCTWDMRTLVYHAKVWNEFEGRNRALEEETVGEEGLDIGLASQAEDEMHFLLDCGVGQLSSTQTRCQNDE